MEELDQELVERALRRWREPELALSPGDAGLLLLAAEQLMSDVGEGTSWVEMTWEVEPGSFDRWDEIAMVEKFGRREVK